MNTLELLYTASDERDRLMAQRYDVWVNTKATCGEMHTTMPTDLRLWLVDELCARLAYDQDPAGDL